MLVIFEIAIFCIAFIIYLAFPLPVKIILTIINFLSNDPIPLVDELLMVIGWFSRMRTGGRVGGFIEWFIDKWEDHIWFRVLSVLVISFILLLLYCLLF